MSCSLKPASEVNTATVVVTGLIGGWLTARETGIRPLGGVVLAAGLGTSYLAAFGLSHPLAKKIGAWPAVIAVTTAVSSAACVLSDLKDAED